MQHALAKPPAGLSSVQISRDTGRSPDQLVASSTPESCVTSWDKQQQQQQQEAAAAAAAAALCAFETGLSQLAQH
jgi:hypothetical protein